MGRAFEWVRETPDAGTMKKSDRIALWGVIVVLVVLVAIEIAVAAWHVIEIAAGPPLVVSLAVHGIPIDGFGDEATATAADVTLSSIEGGERALLIIAQVSGALSWAVLIGCLAVFFGCVARRLPFPRRLPMLLTAGGLGYLILQSVSLATRHAAAMAITSRLDGETFSLDVDFLRVFVVPIVLITIAYVIGAGRRIQKDTEGLV